MAYFVCSIILESIYLLEIFYDVHVPVVTYSVHIPSRIDIFYK